ncbi:hypothetical protein GmHk_15G043186 [Glycine max]|nr:hypothetical protein GmHk_15G043186 [Glycine max]
MALEFPRMVQLGTYLSRGTLSTTPTTVESWWRSLSAHRTQSAAGAPVRTLMTCVSALPQQVHQLRRGGCHNRCICHFQKYLNSAKGAWVQVTHVSSKAIEIN